MNTKPLLAILACVLSLTAFSQPVCGFDISHQDKLQKNARYRSAVEETEKQVQQFIAANRSALTARTTGTNAVLYTIPVVVHVVHTGDGIGTVYNPTDVQIQDAVNYLNQVYNGTYPGTGGIGDIQLQFALATRDPGCKPTSGINRINAASVSAYVAGGVSMNPGVTPGVDELLIKDLSRWSASHYYNIWIVNKIDGKDGTTGTFTAGYAYFPGVPAEYDGTVMLATQMKSGKSTLPHEIGHAFGLYHTFQGSSYNTACPANTDCNTQGDRVCDTDPVTHNYDTLSKSYNFECRTGTNTCSNTAYSTNTESNYMAYTTCNTLFTAGQKSRILGFANSAYRKSLSTSFGLNPVYPVAFSSPSGATCAPATGTAGLSGNYAGILNIELNNRNLGSSSAAYDDGYVDGSGSCLNMIQLTAGSVYTFKVNVLGANQEQLKAWIDYNNDGAFDEATELIHANSSITTGVTSGSFTIPASAVQNTMLRMRVMDDVSTVYAGILPISGGCFNPAYGQAEDYPVYISSGTLPVTLLSFEGVLKNNTAHLLWKTGIAQNLSYFELEKSTDGTSFKKIGLIQGSSQNLTGNYAYADAQVAENNYYRLRIVEKNGNSRLSEVVVIRQNAENQGLLVINNPFRNYLDITLKKSGSLVRLHLISASGTLVAEKTVHSLQGQMRWDLPDNLSRGYYVLKAYVDGEEFVQKLIKQ